MRGSRHKWIYPVLLAILGLWISSVWFVPYITIHVLVDQQKVHGLSASELIAAYGYTGEIFNSVSALFSGLALGAIALTLWLESRSRLESRKPLVISGLDGDDGVVVERPTKRETTTFISVLFLVKTQNQTHDAALNVAIELSIVGSQNVWTEFIDGPLINGIDQNSKIKCELGAPAWHQILDALTSNSSVDVKILTKYRSLEGVDWVTEVIHELRIRKEPKDAALLNSVRANTWDDEVVWEPQAQVAIDSRIKRGSWRHNLA
jgi:hypothetical protein